MGVEGLDAPFCHPAEQQWAMTPGKDLDALLFRFHDRCHKRHEPAVRQIGGKEIVQPSHGGSQVRLIWEDGVHIRVAVRRNQRRTDAMASNIGHLSAQATSAGC